MIKLWTMLTVCALFATAGLSEEEDTFNLRLNMLKLNIKVGQAREGMIRNERQAILREVGHLKTEVHDLLSNKERIESLLPPEKRSKSDIAIEAAKRIVDNIEVIEDAYGPNKRKLSELKRRVAAQRAYTSIEIACFHCHNLVRDID